MNPTEDEISTPMDTVPREKDQCNRDEWFNAPITSLSAHASVSKKFMMDNRSTFLLVGVLGVALVIAASFSSLWMTSTKLPTVHSSYPVNRLKAHSVSCGPSRTEKQLFPSDSK